MRMTIQIIFRLGRVFSPNEGKTLFGGFNLTQLNKKSNIHDVLQYVHGFTHHLTVDGWGEATASQAMGAAVR
jgi:hypothetical protein